MKILLVNTSEELTATLSSQLEKCGQQVAIANNEIEALQMLHNHKIQIAIIDCTKSSLANPQLSNKVCSAQVEHYVYLLAVIEQSQNKNIKNNVRSDVNSILYEPVYQESLRKKIKSAEKVITLENQMSEKNLQTKQTQHIIEDTFAQFAAELSDADILIDDLEEIILSSDNSNVNVA